MHLTKINKMCILCCNSTSILLYSICCQSCNRFSFLPLDEFSYYDHNGTKKTFSDLNSAIEEPNKFKPTISTHYGIPNYVYEE